MPPAIEAPAAPVVPDAPAAPLAAPSTPDAAVGAAAVFDKYFDIPADKPKEQPAAPAKPDAPKAPVVEPEKPKPADVKPDDKTPKPPEKAASLREAKDRVEAENRTLKSKIVELEKKMATPVEDPEKKKLMEERDNWGKTRTELENELKFAKYERSSEYKEKYLNPFVEAYRNAEARVAALKVRDPDTQDEAGVVIPGKFRQLTDKDFGGLMGIVDDDQAWEYSQKTFGDKHAMVWAMREKVNELNAARTKSLDEYRTKGSEREKQLAEQTETQTKQFKGLFDTAVKSAVENPELKMWFSPDDGDDQAKTILERGFKLADDAFGDTNGMAEQAKADLYAAVRNRAAAAGLLAHKLKKTAERVTELETKLKEYEDSEPKLDGKGGRKEGDGKPKSGLSAFDAAVEKAAGMG